MAKQIGTVDTISANTFNATEQLTFGLSTNWYVIKHSQTLAVIDYIKRLPVMVSNRLTTTAGRAVLRNKPLRPHIILHPASLDLDDEIFKSGQGKNTFFHEIAHHVAYVTAKEAGHGFAWQYSLMQFGFKPERCYNPLIANHKQYKQRKEDRIIDEIMQDIPDLEI